MNKLIKLTRYKDSEPLLINPRYIISVGKGRGWSGDVTTIVTTKGANHNADHEIQETTEEVENIVHNSL